MTDKKLQTELQKLCRYLHQHQANIPKPYDPPKISNAYNTQTYIQMPGILTEHFLLMYIMVLNESTSSYVRNERHRNFIRAFLYNVTLSTYI